MTKSDLTTLVKIAKACRKAGIHSFKGYGVEFTLHENYIAPTRRSYKRKEEVTEEVKESVSQAIESDELSPDALLFWSAGDADGAQTDPGETQ